MEKLFSEVKLALRVTGNEFDAEIQNLIAAAFAEIKRLGVTEYDPGDELVDQTVIFYAKANFGENEEHDLWQREFEKNVANLSMSTGYTSWDLPPEGGGGGTNDHSKLENREKANQHPISAITNLQEMLDLKASKNDLDTKFDKTGGEVTGDLKVGKANINQEGFVESTWLKTTAATENNKLTDIAVIDEQGWVYKANKDAFLSGKADKGGYTANQNVVTDGQGKLTTEPKGGGGDDEVYEAMLSGYGGVSSAFNNSYIQRKGNLWTINACFGCNGDLVNYIKHYLSTVNDKKLYPASNLRLNAIGFQNNGSVRMVPITYSTTGYLLITNPLSDEEGLQFLLISGTAFEEPQNP